MIRKIVSGGQTGVDRAALDTTIELGIAHGGWCPRGRKAEDGKIAMHYRLRETPSADYKQRTEWNVRDSDGTLILTHGTPSGGTALTVRFAEALGKPCLVLDLDAAPSAQDVTQWVETNAIEVLNIAGPRESGRPGIYHRAGEFLLACFQTSTNRVVD